MSRYAACMSSGLLVLCATAAHAQGADTTVRVTFGGFVDSYYAYDAGRPATLDRSFAGGAPFTTQPARHNEFNVNLAFLEAVLAGPHVHGRLALQAGTSVQSNYSAEPSRGAVSGASLAQHIQEAYAGVQVVPSLWIDAGVFFSHMGMEGWVSRDNPTYTRSLVAEYSPYYASGVRAIWQPSSRVTVHLHVVNGWQVISETNADKGVGARLDIAPTGSTLVSYYNFINGDAGGRLRLFNGLGARGTIGRSTLLAQVDAGRLGASATSRADSWWGYTLIARRQLTGRIAMSGRVERFDDPGQVNVGTGLGDPFRGDGVSLGVDVAPAPRVLWRTEARGFLAGAPVFPAGWAPPRRRDGFVVSSLAITF